MKKTYLEMIRRNKQVSACGSRGCGGYYHSSDCGGSCGRYYHSSGCGGGC